jgi:hypothetical protein
MIYGAKFNRLKNLIILHKKSFVLKYRFFKLNLINIYNIELNNSTIKGSSPRSAQGAPVSGGDPALLRLGL